MLLSRAVGRQRCGEPVYVLWQADPRDRAVASAQSSTDRGIAFGYEQPVLRLPGRAQPHIGQVKVRAKPFVSRIWGLDCHELRHGDNLARIGVPFALVTTAVATWRRRPVRGYGLALAAAGFFGFNASVSTVVLRAGIEPTRLTAMRCLVGAVCFVLLALLRDRSSLRATRGEIVLLAAVGIFGVGTVQWLYYVALTHLDVGLALLLEFTSPLLVALWARFALGRHVRRVVWIALGLTLLGLALVAQIWRADQLSAIGVGAGIGAAIGLATYFLLSEQSMAVGQRERGHPRDPFSLAAWSFGFAALFWSIAAPWWNFNVLILGTRVPMLGALRDVVVPVWLPTLWIVLLGTVLPFALWLGALRELPAQVAGIASSAEPVFAAGVAWVWLGQALTLPQLAGGATVLVGVGLAQRATSDQAR